MSISQSTIGKIIHYTRIEFPDWQGFNTPSFVADEIAYKRKASEEAHVLLPREEFERLLTEGDIDEILQRLKHIGRATNLLFLSAPQKGDLRLLHLPSLFRCVIDTTTPPPSPPLWPHPDAGTVPWW